MLLKQIKLEHVGPYYMPTDKRFKANYYFLDEQFVRVNYKGDLPKLITLKLWDEPSSEKCQFSITTIVMQKKYYASAIVGSRHQEIFWDLVNWIKPKSNKIYYCTLHIEDN